MDFTQETLEKYRLAMLALYNKRKIKNDEAEKTADRNKEDVPQEAEDTETDSSGTGSPAVINAEDIPSDITADTADEVQATADEKTEKEESDKHYGTLRIEVFAADRAYAIPNAKVCIFSADAPDEMLYTVYTDIVGMTEDLLLEAPQKLAQEENGQEQPFAVYTLRVQHPDYRMAEFTDIPIFDGVSSVQPVQLIPAAQDEPIYYNEISTEEG